MLALEFAIIVERQHQRIAFPTVARTRSGHLPSAAPCAIVTVTQNQSGHLPLPRRRRLLLQGHFVSDVFVTSAAYSCRSKLASCF